MSKWPYLCHVHITLNINRLAFEGILYVLGQDLSQSYPALTLKSLCCIAPASAICSRGPMLTCVHGQRDLYIHSVLSWEWQTHKTHRGAFIGRISSPQLLRVATGSLPIYYHCKSPRQCPPPLQNLYKNISERLGQGSCDAMTTAPTL